MALARLQAVLACFGCIDSPAQTSSLASYQDEKRSLLSSYQPRASTRVADNVVAAITLTKFTGPALHMQLDTIVGATGWTENLAKCILEKLSLALQQAHDNLGPVVRNAYHMAWDVAKGIEGFVVEHPMFCTIIALGVLVIIAPWVIEALGFAELGPVEGTFASWWQSTYGGLIPKGSLFSFFQRLGMVWH
ncbi:hypothetical protein DE146DRAFT_510127 [Phaeosphaeria sp. MPI-PUGE-AT-0046c]|nr:hypothetical protein DE146DRAFT_510127 [Phaeosphaeria sp. MPI-PUGE-AT-0046c]